MRQAPQFEDMLVRDGILLIKFWFSVSRSEQQTRFIIRRIDPVRQWKLSPIDLASLDKWDDYTEAKEAMFFYTDTPHAPWTVVKSNDKKRARIEAMRHVLSRLDYTDRDLDIVGQSDPAIVGPAAYVLETGERADRSFPPLVACGSRLDPLAGRVVVGIHRALVRVLAAACPADAADRAPRRSPVRHWPRGPVRARAGCRT